MRIVRVGDADADILRRKAEPVVKFDESIAGLSNAMIETLEPANGIGLAAPQVGHSLAMFVVDVNKCIGASDTCRLDGRIVKIHSVCPLVAINPKITRRHGKIVSFEEGCLSLPGARGNVHRHAAVDVEFFDCSGNRHTGTFDGILSRCFQHEFDHLKGMLYTDRIERRKSTKTPKSRRRKTTAA
ncbi:MAG: peptide deformylase [Puniceicoccales bacterium]|nr:peptide deformylase [Puniceicoccales bacterium]